MNRYNLEAAPTACAIEIKIDKRPKAKRILLGVDAHLRGYQAGRKIDDGVIGAVDTFRSEVELLLHIAKQQQRAEEVVVVYEAGPLGYTLYRKLKALGVLCYVCAPDSAQQRKKRRKNNKIDARNLTSKLFNYLNGDKEALQLARVPTEAQEQLRLGSRQHDQLVEERKRLGAQGNAMLLSQGFGSWSNWWRPKVWAQLSVLVPAWLLERLQIWVDVLKTFDEKIAQAKAALARTLPAARGPKGWAPSVRCNFKVRCSIGTPTPTVARSLAWRGWCPVNGVPETQNGVAPLLKSECRRSGGSLWRWSGG